MQTAKNATSKYLAFKDAPQTPYNLSPDWRSLSGSPQLKEHSALPAYQKSLMYSIEMANSGWLE